MCGNGLDANPRPSLSPSLSATPSVRSHSQQCLCFWEFCWILCSVCRARIPWMSRGHKKPNAISKFLMCEISNLRFTIFLCWITFTPLPLSPLSLSLPVPHLVSMFCLMFAHFRVLVLGCKFIWLPRCFMLRFEVGPWLFYGTPTALPLSLPLPVCGQYVYANCSHD